jgi:hypothetical protein
MIPANTAEAEALGDVELSTLHTPKAAMSPAATPNTTRSNGKCGASPSPGRDGGLKGGTRPYAVVG